MSAVQIFCLEDLFGRNLKTAFILIFPTRLIGAVAEYYKLLCVHSMSIFAEKATLLSQTAEATYL